MTKRKIEQQQQKILELQAEIESLREREVQRIRNLSLEDLEVDENIRATALATLQRVYRVRHPSGDLVEGVARVLAVRRVLNGAKNVVGDEYQALKEYWLTACKEFLKPLCAQVKDQAQREIAAAREQLRREVFAEIERIKQESGELWPLWLALERRCPNTPISTATEAAARFVLGGYKEARELITLLLGHRAEQLFEAIREAESAGNVPSADTIMAAIYWD